MSDDMRVLRYHGAGVVGLETAPRPIRKPGEVLVRIEASALCGSEREDLIAGHTTNFGHEAAGTVVEIEPGMPFGVGERVGLYAVLGCGGCASCLRGQETMCVKGPEVLSGWHAEYASVPVRSLRSVPQDLDAGLVALMTGDPLGVPSRSARRAPSAAGTTVAVVGLGPVGLAHVLLRAHAGATVIGIEPSEFRRDLARSVGASHTYAPGEYTEQVDLVIECTGVPSVIAQSFDLARNGGVVLQSGECATAVPLSPSDIFIHREITYTGSWYYASEDYPAMVESVASGLPLGSLATHDVRAEDAQPAVTEFLDGRTGKVVFRW